MTGTIDAGAGTNYIGHLRAANALVTLGGTLLAGFSQELVIASGSATQVTIQGPASSSADIHVTGDGSIINQANTTGIVDQIAAFGPFANLRLAAFTNQAVVGGVVLATDALVNSGGITGNVDLFGSSVSLVGNAAGSIAGNIAFHPDPVTGASGTGSIAIAGRFAGNIDGGSGVTSLAVTGGSAAQPVAFGNVANIAGYSQTAGYATIGGIANFGSVGISGGTLVGLVGSTITAPLITVGAHGRFASGGTINGNLLVDGALHVGASPDTMTVNGNVALGSGSTSIFEVSLRASSRLLASGTVAIASGVALQIVPLQPIMPGTTLNLISAAGGITGNFSTLAGITGQIIDKGGNLSVLALFDTAAPANPQVGRSIAYVNAVLASGNAPPALFTALSALTSPTGAPVTPAFARLNGEAYASATQIEAENALTLSRTARDIVPQTALHSGDVFTFGQALGGWRGLDGSAARGTSVADISGYGFVGGLGLRHGPVAIAAFGGYLDQTQTIAPLAASTQAKGFVGGVIARLDSDHLRLSASALYDDARATTRRAAPDQTKLSAGYSLHSWSLDAAASTQISLSADWVLRPHVGATWAWIRRGSADETADSIFALAVAPDHHAAGWIDGGLRFETAERSTSRFTRFVDLGWRWQLQGRSTQALAGFAGQPKTLLASGVTRRAASALISAGGTYRLTPAVSLFVSGSGELTIGGSSANATGGISMLF